MLGCCCVCVFWGFLGGGGGGIWGVEWGEMYNLKIGQDQCFIKHFVHRRWYAFSEFDKEVSRTM